MSPAPRTAIVVAALALLALIAPSAIIGLGLLALLAGATVDARAARRPPSGGRTPLGVLSRGVPAPMALWAALDGASAIQVRQPLPPEAQAEPSIASARLETSLLPVRRGRHRLPAGVARVTGPLGLWRHDHVVAPPVDLVVYPDLPAARRLVLAVRQGRLRGQGELTRGPLGLGTSFDHVREYSPDDDIRQLNWRATARVGRPMSNEYRVDRDRDVLCVVDAGRLMGAPVGERTRLDIALDALTAVVLVADEVGDRAGCLAFDATVQRHVPPRRRGGQAVVDALFDLEPTSVDSDYEGAFHRAISAGKRALVVVFTDLLDEAAGRSLIEATPVLSRRHAVVVAAATDPDLTALLHTPPGRTLGALAASVAVELLEARTLLVGRLRAAGATVVEASPDGLGQACVNAYLEQKARARV